MTLEEVRGQDTVPESTARWVLGCRELGLSGSDLSGSFRREVCRAGAMQCLAARSRGTAPELLHFDSCLELRVWGAGPWSGLGSLGYERQIRSKEPRVQAPGRDWVMGNEGARS